MSVNQLNHSTAAIKAYEKAGFSKNLVEMRMEIRDI